MAARKKPRHGIGPADAHALLKAGLCPSRVGEADRLRVRPEKGETTCCFESSDLLCIALFPRHRIRQTSSGLTLSHGGPMLHWPSATRS